MAGGAWSVTGSQVRRAGGERFIEPAPPARGTARDAGTRIVVRFILAVWNGSPDFWKSGPFALRDLGKLDDKNLEAWKTWAARPFFL